MIKKVLGAIALILAMLVFGAWNFHTTFSVERTFNAPKADVWRVWTNADSIQKWWGPKGYTALVVRNNVAESGSYLWAMKSDQGRISWTTGVYREVVANEKIVSTMSFADETGKSIPASQASIPGNWPDEIIVATEFRESSRETTVRVTEAGIPLIVYPFSKIGWAQQFDKIQALL
jgi:uncharacterized protein YndB with AHSA1/START domain